MQCTQGLPLLRFSVRFGVYSDVVIRTVFTLWSRALCEDAGWRCVALRTSP